MMSMIEQVCKLVSYQPEAFPHCRFLPYFRLILQFGLFLIHYQMRNSPVRYNAFLEFLRVVSLGPKDTGMLSCALGHAGIG